MTPSFFTLSNGLRVVLVPMPGMHHAAVSLMTRVGSRFETPQQNGISHFVEHMLFRGSATLPDAHGQALAFETFGATPNARTSVDHGEVHTTLPSENLHQVLTLLADVIAAPRFTEIEAERRIVVEEILEDQDGDGQDVDPDNNMARLLYGSHPLGHTLTGKAEDLAGIDDADLRAHHARHYTGENIVLAIAGRIELDGSGNGHGEPSTQDLIADVFSGIPRGKRIVCYPPAVPIGPRCKFIHSDQSQTELRVAFRAVGHGSLGEPAMEMLLRVLDDGMSTRLYERITLRLGLCYDVHATVQSFEDDGVFEIHASAAHENAPRVVAEVLSLLRELAENGPTVAEMEKALRRERWQRDTMLDDPEALARHYAFTVLQGMESSPARRHEQLARVTASAVRDFARDVFIPQRLHIVAVGDLDEDQQEEILQLMYMGLVR